MNTKHNLTGRVPESKAGYEASAELHTDGSETAPIVSEVGRYSSRAYDGLATEAEVRGTHTNLPTKQPGDSGQGNPRVDN